MAVQLQAEIKRGFLSSLYRQCQRGEAASPLYDALGAFQDNGFASCQSGRLVVTHAGAGKSVTFQVPAIGQQFSQEMVFGLSQEFLEAYADALTTLGLTQPQDTSQDAAVFACMMNDDRFQAVTSVMKDYTALNFGGR